MKDLIAENKRLGLDEEQDLATQIRDVNIAILRLGSEVHSQNKALHSINNAVSRLEAEAELPSMTIENASAKIMDMASIEESTLTRWMDQMKDLSCHLSSLSQNMESTASDQMVLRSLYFEQIEDRQTSIAEAHRDTFVWLLDPSSKSNFAQWLEYQAGIYWINGKAGSGKSTLMKFLARNAQARKALRLWADNHKLVVASFYFWNAGTALQKSQEGLLRSLLYEILRQCPDLVCSVCASKLETFKPFVGDVEPWTWQELWHAIEKLKDQTGTKARLCFFIDGLDEYDGEPDDIISLFESLREWPMAKLCVSSRPWNDFIDAFGRPSDPQLALQDLTRGDIKTYVEYVLERNTRFEMLRIKDVRTQDLVEEITMKARGVFLWVVLVVRSLLNGS